MASSDGRAENPSSEIHHIFTRAILGASMVSLKSKGTGSVPQSIEGDRR